MKRSLALLLLLAMLLSVVPAMALEINMEGFPLVTEPITLSITGRKDSSQTDWAKNEFFIKYQEMTGVTLDFQEVPQASWDERKSLMFAANEVTDIIMIADLTTAEIVSYGVDSGQLLELEGLMAEYMPNFMALCEQYPEIVASITAPNGHIYTIPSVQTSDVHGMDFKQWINEGWLAQTGLGMPTTPDEFIEVLRYFRDNDMDGDGDATNEIPFAMRDVNAVYKTLASVWGLGKQMNYQINITDDDKIDIWLDNDEYKEYLMFLNQLYSEGLLWTDYYKRDLPAWRSNLANGTFGAFHMPFSDVFINRELDFIAFPPMIGPYGHQMWTDVNSRTPTIGAYAVSVDCEYPELALKWLDYFYSEEGAIFFRFGTEGETFYYGEDGKPYLSDEIMNDPRGLLQAYGEYSLIPGIGNGCPHWVSNLNNSADATAHCIEVASVFVPYLPEVYYDAPIFDSETNDRISVIANDVNTYRDQSATRFIVGEVGFDQWDDYVATINQVGLGELEAAYQEAYDKIIAAQ